MTKKGDGLSVGLAVTHKARAAPTAIPPNKQSVPKTNVFGTLLERQ